MRASAPAGPRKLSQSPTPAGVGLPKREPEGNFAGRAMREIRTCVPTPRTAPIPHGLRRPGRVPNATTR